MFNSNEKKLKAKIDSLEYDVQIYKGKAERVEKELQSITGKYNVVEAKNKEIKQLIRDQTDADLLINALKAIGVIEDKEKTDHRAEQQRLMGIRQMTGLQNGEAQHSQGLQQLFGGLLG